jgi:hypothetical protein
MRSSDCVCMVQASTKVTAGWSEVALDMRYELSVGWGEGGFMQLVQPLVRLKASR